MCLLGKLDDFEVHALVHEQGLAQGIRRSRTGQEDILVLGIGQPQTCTTLAQMDAQGIFILSIEFRHVHRLGTVRPDPDTSIPVSRKGRAPTDLSGPGIVADHPEGPILLDSASGIAADHEVMRLGQDAFPLGHGVGKVNAERAGPTDPLPTLTDLNGVLNVRHHPRYFATASAQKSSP